MKKISFEDACLIGHVSAKELRENNLKELMDRKRKALADVGWTYEELSKESRNRLLQRIEKNERIK